MGEHKHYRSLFWPVVLIGVGIVWFLSNMGVLSLSIANLAVLLRLWPIFLIVLGLDLLFGRRSPVLGGLLGFGAAVAVLVLVLAGPAMGLVNASNIQIKSDHYSAPLGSANSARIELDLPIGQISVHALSDSKSLIEADVSHAGEVDFSISGEREKTVILKEHGHEANFDLLGWFDSADKLASEIGLSPDVPLDLSVNLNVGEARLDLRQLQLSNLTVQGDVGHVDLTLPATDQRYTANLKGNVGGFDIKIPQAADIDLTVNGDVGGFSIDVPPDAGVRIEARVDVGSIGVPASFRRVSRKNDDFIGERGVWESANYSNADRKITIVFRGDVGGLDVR